ncbi:Globin-coupled histidine kinase [Pannonibacter phragmitetus]|uniref:histidine kinase n=1 Tax=Pannonibacter phragmitetus TaxID=121719 RepID=A0A378ZXG4_9HYPH|nr:ATP-binding protein [Pannonibacter phragmitetus]SUB01926.1 Globin-coupled histidine kinase [Pannonibacter phragmitetus]
MAKFGVGARVIDLLGKQQVAGTPTAISELFKNAHDAYARNAEVDFYRVRNLLILRDDGVGMSREDFETRWLTAATDSKRKTGYIQPPETDPDQDPRPVMGEKGIGRLAIAVLGKQVLVLTRKKTKDNSAPVIAALVHWDLFNLPNIHLGDLDIPLRELPPGNLPDQSVVNEMIGEAKANLAELRSKTDAALVDEIEADLSAFAVDPAKLADAIVRGPDLRGEGHGTHFYIAPTNETLGLDIDEGDDDKATPMQKALLGFCNTMAPGHIPPPMRTSFRDHKGEGLWEDIIGENQFFSPEEFEKADHQVFGSFDEYGQFSGTVQIFGSDPKAIRIHWPNERGQITRCGPFKISFAYVQGTRRETKLPSDLWQDMSVKLNRIGGLYLYRDGIRILPYGDSDYDFLEIERRRTKSAGYYFFSYRRLFGVIETTRAENEKLVEKAGREGFQANAAYKEFKHILENFFIQLAAEFFREGGTSSDEFIAIKEENTRNFEILRRRERQVSSQRRKLSADLDDFFSKFNERAYETSVQELIESFDHSLSALSANAADADALIKLERDAVEAIDRLQKDSRVVRPRGVGLTKEQSRHWARYEVERQRLDNNVFAPAMDRVRALVSSTLERLGLAIHARKIAYEAITSFTNDSERRVRRLSSEVRSGADEFREQAVQRTKDSIRTVKEIIEAKLIEFERTVGSDMPLDEVARVQFEIEREIQSTTEKQSGVLQRLVDQLRQLSAEEDWDTSEILAAMETDLEDRRAREEENLQLAQMGQAIGIVHHEFNSVIRSVRRNVRRLEPWAERNEKLRKLYNEISDSYAHLDSYLSLFAPLSRRLSQTKRVISGGEIANYLQELLGDRMHRHEIEFVATEAFKAAEVEAYVSTLYPAFVNIVDNALFWVTHGEHVRTTSSPLGREKRVFLDYSDGEFVISDTGPGVLPVDELAIFETGFSRKPKGSGLGLSITRELLDRQGYHLSLDSYREGQGATFRIRLPENAFWDDEK